MTNKQRARIERIHQLKWLIQRAYDEDCQPGWRGGHDAHIARVNNAALWAKELVTLQRLEDTCSTPT